MTRDWPLRSCYQDRSLLSRPRVSAAEPVLASPTGLVHFGKACAVQAVPDESTRGQGNTNATGSQVPFTAHELPP